MSPAQTPVPASTSPSAEPPAESPSTAGGDLLRRFWPFLAVAIFAGALVLHRELSGAICPSLGSVGLARAIEHPGGHRVSEGDGPALADTILDALPKPD
jgi:hypothetical protein